MATRAPTQRDHEDGTGRGAGDGGGRSFLSRLPPFRPGRVLAFALACALMAGVGVGVGTITGGRKKPTTAQLMGLSKVPNRAAPGFTLTDQAGRAVSLASLRGKVVALYFMDPRCTDVCPLVAQEFIEADHHLGAAARHVDFVGVDVNPHYTARKWLDRFDAEHGLDHLSNWYYLTGSLHRLEKVWSEYNVAVSVTHSGDVQHTTIIDFIAANGHERALAVPFAYTRHNGTGWLPHGEISQWGSGIAAELRRLI